MKKTSIARRLAAFAGISLVLGLTACSPAQPQSTELKTDNYQLSMTDWRQKTDDCMLTAGFPLTGPNDAPGGMTSSVDMSQYDMVAFDAAYAKCAQEIGDPPVDENQPSEQEMFDSQLAFASCMREAGYDVPDPVKGQPSAGGAFGPETDMAVFDKCEQKASSQVNGK